MAGLVVVVAMISIGLVRIVSTGSAPPEAGPISPAGSEASAPFPLSDASFVSVRTGDSTPLPKSIRSVRFADHIQLSPDGATIAFDDGHQIYVAELDGTDPRAVTQGPDTSVTPSWSPDGTELVYVRDGNLFAVEPKTEVSRQLTDLPGEMWLPSFSPDGRLILFTMTSGGGRWMDLWTMPVGGGRPSRLLDRAAYGMYSPDGRKIAYYRVGKAVEPRSIWPWDFVLRLADADGTPLRSISAGNGGNTMAPFDWDWMRPAWSPDGTRIVYQSEMTSSPSGDIRIVDVVNGEATVIGSGAFPTWVDGNTLVVENYRPAR